MPREALDCFQRYQQATATADDAIQKRLSRYLIEATELLSQEPPTALAAAESAPAQVPAGPAAALPPPAAIHTAAPPEATGQTVVAATEVAPAEGALGSAPSPALATGARIPGAVRGDPPAAPRPLYKRPWFWTVIGAVVAGGVTGIAAGTLTPKGSNSAAANPDLIWVPPQALSRPA